MAIPALNLISDYSSHYASLVPTRQALVLDGRRVTYAQLVDKVDECARALIATGVKKGDRIATLSPPHPDFFILFLASASIGTIWMGLDPRYQLDELRYVIGDAQPRYLFTRTRIGKRHYDQELTTLNEEHACLQELIVISDDFVIPGVSTSYAEFSKRAKTVTKTQLKNVREPVSRDDPALLVYTSGTSGKPKGALIPHRGLVKCARVQLKYLDVNPMRILNYLPVNHIGCVGDICCYALVGGGTIIFMEQFEPARSMEITQDEKITLWGGVPASLQMCIGLPGFSAYDLSAIQIIAWGGAAASDSLIRKLLDICPRLACSYGQTETVGSVSFVTPCNDVEVLKHTVGQPVSEYEIRIACKAGKPVKPGESGEIQVRGDFIMQGYWKQPEKTAETIDADGWLHTGDLGLIREDGNLQLIGRLTEMFKSGGYNVYPREIEQTLEKYPGVALAAVISIPDPLYQEVSQAYVLPEHDTELSAAELELYCRRHLANYKIPKKFFVESKLPMLPIGKIDKLALKRSVPT